MNKHWLKWAARYDALQLRERWLVAAAVLGGIVLIGYSLFVEPALQRARQAESRVEQSRLQIANTQAQSLAQQSASVDPNVVARAELDRLKKQLRELDGRLERLDSSLVAPQRMAGLMEDLIGRKTGLRLLAVKTLPVAPLLEKGPEAVAKGVNKPVNSSSGLFRHGVEIKLEGSYQELSAYLERLEQSKLKLLWSSVILSADNHPKLVLTLTVFTLSLDRAWLIV